MWQMARGHFERPIATKWPFNAKSHTLEYGGTGEYDVKLTVMGGANGLALVVV